jgi:HAD superfamily hydrolase (TIGR01509 family)
VLSDTQTIHATIESQLIAEHGGHATPDELTRDYAGVPTRTFLPKFITVSPEQLTILMQEKERRFHEAIAHTVPAIPGAIELVRRLHAQQVPLAIASGSTQSTVMSTLRGLGIHDCFRAIVSADDVIVGKPSPDVFMEAALRLAVPFNHCIVIEDGVAGMLGGKAAGMRVIALATRKQEYPADYVVWKLDEITDEMLR